MPTPPLRVNPKKTQFPGDTVTVNDPPTSNGAGTDAFDEEKGIKAPPGARGEYTEKPSGNYGGSGGTIGVDPLKFVVDYNNNKRNQIPPIFRPQVASRHANLSEMVAKVRGALSDELRRPKYRGNENPMAGHCYVASEALYHLLGGKPAGYTPYFIRHEGEPHWFLKGPQGVLDVTSEQFQTPVPYNKAIAKGFLTSAPSARARQVIDTVRPVSREAAKKGADEETEQIKKNREKHTKPHKFKQAEWTHPNGHPRCILCGAEERIDGMCEGYDPSVRHHLGQLMEDLDNDEEMVEASSIFERELVATSIHRIPDRRPELDERLLLQIPHDVQERYNDLNRRVSDYVKGLKFNALDMYDFPSDPPEDWVEKERLRVEINWDDHDAWSAYLGKLNHDDVADWIGLEAIGADELNKMAPNLVTQHALETGGTEDFSSWFRANRPAIKDDPFISYVKDTAKSFPQDGLGKGYSGFWRKRNQTMVREVATNRARERHDRYLREVEYPKYVRPQYKESFEKLRGKDRLPLNDSISALQSLPHEVEAKETVEEFRRDHDGMLDEGMHALDLYREPISRDDRLTGDMNYLGERVVPVSRIEAAKLPIEISHSVVDRYDGGYTEEKYTAFLGEVKAGVLHYFIYPDKPLIRITFLDVDQEYQRQGIAADLIQKLRNDYPNVQIEPGSMSADGLALLRAFDPNIKVRRDPTDDTSYPYELDAARRKEGIQNDRNATSLDSRSSGGGRELRGATEGTTENSVKHDRQRCRAEGRQLVGSEGASVPTQESKRQRHIHDLSSGEKSGRLDDDSHSPFRGTAQGQSDRPSENLEGHTPVLSKRAFSDALQSPIALYRYGSRYFLVYESDRARIDDSTMVVRAHVYDIVPGSSIQKAVATDLDAWRRKSSALAKAIREIQAGSDKEAVFTKWGREYGPGLRHAVSDYLYVTKQHKQSDGGGGSSGSSIGDATCSSFEQQSPDNCDGCTFNSGTGGPEFGYGGNQGACLLSELFINAPEEGFGRGDPAAYDFAHMPGRPSVQKPKKQLYR